MLKIEQVTVSVGSLSKFKTIDEALDWIDAQKGYKNKTVHYRVRCSGDVEVD